MYKIRQLRLEKGFSLDYMCQKTGFSKGYLSLLERGFKNPSITTLRKISDCLNVPLMSFFSEDADILSEENLSENNKKYNIIRKDHRKKAIPELYTNFELITPLVTSKKNEPDITGIYSCLDPGCWSAKGMLTHDDDESIYIIKGKAKVVVCSYEIELDEGDSIYISRNSPHNIYNNGDGTLIFLDYVTKVL